MRPRLMAFLFILATTAACGGGSSGQPDGAADLEDALPDGSTDLGDAGADSTCGQIDAGPPPQVDEARMLALVTELASAPYGGRATGSEGGERTRQLIESLFVTLGLQPGGDDGGFRQAFVFPAWELLAPGSLELDGAPLLEGTDFYTLDWSGTAALTAPVVFVGYGMRVDAFTRADYPECPFPETGFDEYAGIDVRGKLVLALRQGPPQSVPYSRCPAQASWHTVNTFKAQNAQQRGAAGLILLPRFFDDEPAAPLESIGNFGYRAAFAALGLDRDVAVAHIPALPAWAGAIDTDLTLSSQDTGVTAAVTTSTRKSDGQGASVIGVLPGAGPVAGERLIVGAHFDHLGTLRDGTLYPGADDNASGVAVLLELARAFTASGREPARTIVFAAYDGEELGLLGSCTDTAALADPAAVKAMIAIDMVGAGDAVGLKLHGTENDSLAWLADLAEAGLARDGFSDTVVRAAATDSSDHACYAGAGISAILAVSSGQHPNYHSPADTAAAVSPAILGLSARVLLSLLRPLAAGEEECLLAP